MQVLLLMLLQRMGTVMASGSVAQGCCGRKLSLSRAQARWCGLRQQQR
jgi:hypothetical protein